MAFNENQSITANGFQAGAVLWGSPPTLWNSQFALYVASRSTPRGTGVGRFFWVAGRISWRRLHYQDIYSAALHAETCHTSIVHDWESRAARTCSLCALGLHNHVQPRECNQAATSVAAGDTHSFTQIHLSPSAE